MPNTLVPGKRSIQSFSQALWRRVNENGDAIVEYLRVRKNPRGDERYAAGDLLVDLQWSVGAADSAGQQNRRLSEKSADIVLRNGSGKQARLGHSLLFGHCSESGYLLWESTRKDEHRVRVKGDDIGERPNDQVESLVGFKAARIEDHAAACWKFERCRAIQLHCIVVDEADRLEASILD